MHIAFAGGGTAGHVTPALSIANAIKAKYPDFEIVFFTSPAGVEKEILKNYPYPIVEIPIHNLSRNLSWKTLRTAAEIPLSTARAARVLRERKIDLVIGTGGYVTYPVIRAAQKLKIPNYLHESNSIPGLVTTILAKRASGVLTNFSSCNAYFTGGCKHHEVGNFILEDAELTPHFKIRSELGMKVGEKLIVVIGGSLGAMPLNKLLLEMLKKHLDEYKKTHFLISTGSKNFDSVKEMLQALFHHLPNNIHIFPYLSPIGDYLRAADMAITRAGACTLSELCYYQVPAIVIPYPQAAKNHQKYNAIAFQSAKCGIYLEESDTTSDLLSNRIHTLLFSQQMREEMLYHQRRAFAVNRYQELFNLIFAK